MKEKPQDEAFQFKKLARTLLAVPKKEIDEKKTEYDKRKAQEKKKRTT